MQVWFLFYLTTPLTPAHTSPLLNPHAQTSFTTQPCALNAQRQKGSLAEQGSPASPTTCCPSSEQDEGTLARSFMWYSFLALQRGSKSHHSILHLPFCTCSIMGICWSTFQDVSKPSPSLSQRIMRRTGKRQISPHSVLRGKIKSWFKHQPQLDRVRHMIFTAAHTQESTSRRLIKHNLLYTLCWLLCSPF